MEFTSNLWMMVTESDRIPEEHKKELFEILTDIQNLEADQIENGSNIKKTWHNIWVQKHIVVLGDRFENLYIKYGGYTGMLNECKRLELKRKEGEINELLPKIPDSIKRRFKVK